MSILITELEELLADDRSEISLILGHVTRFCWRGGTERGIEILIQRYVVEDETSKLENAEEWIRWIERVEKTKDIEGYLDSLRK